MSSPIPNHPLLHIPRPAQQPSQNPLSDLYNAIANIHLPTLLLKQPQHTPPIQVSEKLDNFITLQQQLLSPHTLTIHQLSSTITSSNPPTPTPISDYTPSLAHSSTSTESSTSTNRAYRTFKRKFPNHPFPSKPGTAREFINHPDHTNTRNFLQITLPLFPQYTLNQSDSNPEPRHFVDEHVLIPTLHWRA